MRCTLILLVSLLLTAGMAWAGDDDFLAEAGGGCMLPDLTGLSPEQAAAAAFAAGFQASANEVQAPACPVRFDCDSIGNCAAGPVCSLTDIGACCQTSGGPVLCCINGTIKVKKCPCQCTSFLCSILCANSTDVKWRCV